MKTHYPYFFIKFSKDNLSPLEPAYTNSWKKNFLKNCPLKGTSSGGFSKSGLEPGMCELGQWLIWILARHIRKWFIECFQRKSIFYPRSIPISNGQTQIQSQQGIVGGSANAPIIQIPIFWTWDTKIKHKFFPLTITSMITP